MENQNETMQVTLNKMHESIDKFIAAFAALAESVAQKPRADLTEEMKKAIITDVCDNISEIKIRDEVVNRLVEDFDTSSVEERVAENIGSDISNSDIEERVVENLTDSISLNEIAEKVAESYDNAELIDMLSDKLAARIVAALKREVAV